jgi:inactivated superfamily I helicase
MRDEIRGFASSLSDHRIRGLPMTNIAKARRALEELRKSAAPYHKQHFDTLSDALESLGKRVNELERVIADLVKENKRA